MDNNKFISLDDFTNVLNDIVTKINQSYVKKETNVLTKTVFIYKYSDTIPTVMPSSINWDVNQNIVTISAGEGWMLSTDEYDANGRALWMSSGTLNSLTPTNITWATPIRLTGERGPAGLDGTILEYKYRLTQNDLAIPAGPDAAPDAWTNTPSGVSLTNQAEWVCSRYKEALTSDFTDWSTPVLWSKYGVNGVDGNGYEYIYFRNNGEGVPSIPAYDVNSEEYQLDEYIPQGWNDDPQGVTENQRYEWMSSRKKQNQTWGPFKTPSVWAKFGEKGDTGYLIKTLYTKTVNAEEPIYVYNEVNPGSGWSSKMPKYNAGEYVWEIKAYFDSDNEFVEITGSDGQVLWGWSEPILVSGIKGDTGSVPNYKVYVYKFATTQPNKPQTDSITSLGEWEDYPVDMGEAEGKWWQCVGEVNGNTNLVMSWSDVIPLTGATGDNTEFRFRITSDSNTPSVVKTSRIPNGWSLLSEMTSTEIPANGALWQIIAEVNGEYLRSEWSSPVRISGEKGDTGAAGPIGENGPAGVPGSDMVYRYCLGTSTTPTRSWENDPDIVVNENFPYVWAEQGRQSYHLINGEPIAGEIEWSGKPFKFTSKDGNDGRSGQLVYPAGAYNVEAAYECTADIAPYVYYDGEYYVMNRQMIWIGTEQGNKTPKDNVENDGGTCWKKFESFQALHAQVGIIENGLIGSAVFNGDYMFSQWGICSDGTVTDESMSNEVLRSCFEKFNPNDPYGEDAEFKPNICFNLKTGKVWLNAGKTVFNSDGSGYLVNGKIAWDSNGDIDVNELNALGIIASDISADTITGKTIKSTDETSFVLDENGTFSLGNDAISYDGGTISISGQNVEIDGNVKINGSAIMAGIETDASEEFKTLVSSSITADEIIGNEIIGKTVRSDNQTSGGTATWILQNSGAGHLAKGNIAWDTTGNLTISGALKQKSQDVDFQERKYAFWDGEEMYYPPQGQAKKIHTFGQNADIYMCSSKVYDESILSSQSNKLGKGYIEYTGGWQIINLGMEFDEAKLPTDSSFVGRKLTIANHYNDTIGYTQHTMEFALPEDKDIWVYENGRKCKTLTIGFDDIVELFGIGTDNKLLGWVVTNRIDISNNHNASRFDTHGMYYGLRPSILGISNNYAGYGDSSTGYLYLHPWLHTIVYTKDSSFRMRLPYNFVETGEDALKNKRSNLTDGLQTGQTFEIWLCRNQEITVELNKVTGTNNANSVIVSLVGGKLTEYSSSIKLTTIGKHKFVWDGYNWFHSRSA